MRIENFWNHLSYFLIPKILLIYSKPATPKIRELVEPTCLQLYYRTSLELEVMQICIFVKNHGMQDKTEKCILFV